MNTRTQKITYIDVKSIVSDLRRSAIDPTCLLVLHALSGCDSTSFIKNIAKEKVFSCFFHNPSQYSSINKLNCILPPRKSITACERLTISCYSFDKAVISLDELRAVSKFTSCLFGDIYSSKQYICFILFIKRLIFV